MWFCKNNIISCRSKKKYCPFQKKFPQDLCPTSDSRTHVILFWELKKSSASIALQKCLVHYIPIHMVKDSLGKYPILLPKGNAPPGTVGYVPVIFLKLPVTCCRIKLPSNWEGPEKGWRAEEHKQCNCLCQVKLPCPFSVDVWPVTAPEASAKAHQENIGFVKTWEARK